MGKKTVRFNPAGIEKLPENKPVIYRIESAGGRQNYVGIAKRGRVQDRIAEHLPGAKEPVPGSKVQIEQMPSIRDALKKEQRIIARTQPPHNRQGK
jgi:hypothetical protein